MLTEILDTRVMVKAAMKRHPPAARVRDITLVMVSHGRTGCDKELLSHGRGRHEAPPARVHNLIILVM